MTDDEKTFNKIMARCEERDGHLIWTGYNNEYSCPQIVDSATRRRVSVRRWLWEHEHGRLDDNILVRVTCDEPLCLRHVELATKSELRLAADRPSIHLKPRADESIDDVIQRGIEVEGECWIWRGSVSNHGSPRVTHNKIYYFPRRYLWEREHGVKLAKHSIVRSTCDNSRCVNPAHSSTESPRGWEDNMIAAKERRVQATQRPIDRLADLARRCGYRLAEDGIGVWKVERT